MIITALIQGGFFYGVNIICLVCHVEWHPYPNAFFKSAVNSKEDF